jgi:hypothetical protein
MEMVEVEKLEKKYLDILDELLYRNNFINRLQNSIDKVGDIYFEGKNSMSVGTERMAYNLINSNSLSYLSRSNFDIYADPVSSDLAFQNEEVVLHLDIKNFQLSNINDMQNAIAISNNQTSYRSEIKQQNGFDYNPPRYSNPNLDSSIEYYNDTNKVILTYFLVVLINENTLEILSINLLSMPNGLLEPHYNSRPLQSGKNYPTKQDIRFRFSSTPKFELLENQPSRIKVVYLAPNISEEHKKKLLLFSDLYQKS